MQATTARPPTSPSSDRPLSGCGRDAQMTSHCDFGHVVQDTWMPDTPCNTYAFRLKPKSLLKSGRPIRVQAELPKHTLQQFAAPNGVVVNHDPFRSSGRVPGSAGFLISWLDAFQKLQQSLRGTCIFEIVQETIHMLGCILTSCTRAVNAMNACHRPTCMYRKWVRKSDG